MFDPIVSSIRLLNNDLQSAITLIQLDILVRIAEVIVLAAIARRMYKNGQ